MPIAYCAECDWEREASADEITDLGRAMIDHYVETGHSPVERRDAADRLEAADRLAGVDRTESAEVADPIDSRSRPVDADRVD